jgi:hypothetical protein
MSGVRRPNDEVEPCTPTFPPLPSGLELTPAQWNQVNAIQLGFAKAVATLQAEALAEIQQIVHQGGR